MLHASWVDRIFAKLTVRYGQAFMRQYSDLDPALVKADWAEVLAGFDGQPDALKYAIENLPDAPPNATQFRAIARRAPSTVLALPAPRGDKPPPEVRKRLAELLQRMRAPA